LNRIANRLGDARSVSGNGFNFPVKIDFQSERCGIEDRSAVMAIAQVALDFASHLGGQPAFQVFANKADRSFARHGHIISPRPEKLEVEHAISQNIDERLIFPSLL
jgi:hypothetical protein